MVNGARDMLINALLESIAPSKRVLLVNTSFDVLTRLATLDIRELVHIGPDADPGAPAGKAPNGARLHLRPDWQERPRSKDLIVDLDGQGHWADVNRVLKKQGLYLTTTDNAITAQLEHVKRIDVRTLGIMWANCVPKRNALPKAWASVESAAGPALVLASRHAFSAPSLYSAWTMDGYDVYSAGLQQLNDATVEIDALNETLSKHKAEIDGLHARLAEAESTVNASQLAKAAIVNQLEDREAEISKQSAAHEALQAEHTELLQKYDETRHELASRRAEVRRTQRVDQRVNQVKVELTDELNALRARLRDIDAHAADTSNVIEERNLYRVNFEDAVTRFYGLLQQSVGTSTLPEVPQPGIRPEQRAALSGWFETAADCIETQSTQSEAREQLIRSLRARLAAASRRTKLLEASSAEISRPAKARSISIKVPSIKDNTLAKKVEALSTALEAERVLREQAEQRVTDLLRVSERALNERSTLADQLESALDASVTQMTRQVLQAETMQTLQSEMKQKNDRLKELESMLATHHRLQAMMSEAMKAAENARDEAETARRLADQNLKIMRHEYERLQAERGQTRRP
ncbi:MAG: hypothetical protein VX589_19950 [Myxococcota bacterium]|nr:hypothetical protein [Myxococcota bacterium]